MKIDHTEKDRINQQPRCDWSWYREGCVRVRKLVRMPVQYEGPWCWLSFGFGVATLTLTLGARLDNSVRTWAMGTGRNSRCSPIVNGTPRFRDGLKISRWFRRFVHRRRTAGPSCWFAPQLSAASAGEPRYTAFRDICTIFPSLPLWQALLLVGVQGRAFLRPPRASLSRPVHRLRVVVRMSWLSKLGFSRHRHKLLECPPHL